MLKVGIAAVVVGLGLVTTGGGVAPSVSMPVGDRHLTLFPAGIGLLVGLAGVVLILGAALRRSATQRATIRRDPPS